MKLLLDENLPRRLKKDLHAYKIFTVRDMGWTGKKNGELLTLMLQNGFNVLLTFDRNLQHQQNFSKYPVAVFVLNAPGNDYGTLQPLMPLVISLLEQDTIQPGPVVVS
ncbi:MAG: hypothetical protein DYG98_19275 [Haliscomenobacteraceae bacterium CHB4]|nr:hypothetical protein [Saprospiraceae bacterium]MCE7925202.1 hypothetical protein [Haliscomenobacteraceae bacterium CHB4]